METWIYMMNRMSEEAEQVAMRQREGVENVWAR